MRVRGWIVALGLGAAVVVGACRAPLSTEHPARAGVPAPPEAIVRGAPLYAAYCAGCHGEHGAGDGAVAMVLGLRPADLRAPTLLAASDDAIVDRLLQGTPLRAAPRNPTLTEDVQVAALDAYVRALPTQDWNLLRAGRIVFEGECASCHGVYGNGDGVLSAMVRLPPANLAEARERYGDDALAGISVRGIGAMPPMAGSFAPGEMAPLIAYVRHLSNGYRIYDTYCALCHGDDGRGVHPEDLLPPGAAAPPLDVRRLARLSTEERRGKILHMVRREQGTMPHFRGVLGADRLRDIVAYLRMMAS